MILERKRNFHPGGRMRLNYGHPLIQRPVVCVVAGTDGRPLDLVRNQAINSAGAGPFAGQVIHTEHGPAIDATTAATEWDLRVDTTNASLSSIRWPTNMVTVACLKRHTDTTLRTGAVCGFQSNTGNLRLGLQAPDSSGNILWDFGGSTGNNRLTSASGGKTTNWETYVGVAGNRGAQLFKNGIRLVGHNVAISRVSNSPSFRFNGGANASDATGDIQQIALFLMLEFEWSGPQAIDWCRNPWQIFSVAPFSYYMPIPAAGGSVAPLLHHHLQTIGAH